MKTAKDFKKEVDSTLKEKSNEALKVFQAQREKDLEELASFSEQLEIFEKKKKDLLATQEAEKKNFAPSNRILSECYQKLHYTEQNIQGIQKLLDALFKKLTTIDKSVESVLPFMKLIQG